MHKFMQKLVFFTCILFSISSHAADPEVLRLATTTSTDNSGLLQKLLPTFEQQYGYQVHVIAVGTGKALRMGRDGDVDVVLVHAPAAEKQFVDDGSGVNYRQVMYNDFIIVGPKSDPASIRGMKNATDALKKMVEKQSPFVSRGDNSGTHKMELGLWKAAGIKPAGSWYKEAGQGMGRVLQMAGELEAYTLTDRGTWLSMQSKSPLNLVVEGDERLFNPYGVIAVNPARYPDVNYRAAMAFIGWLTSPSGQAMIHDFKIHNETLFSPLAIAIP